MPIDRNTPYRTVGPVPYATWSFEIGHAGGRNELMSRNAWIAAGTLSGVLLRILNQESSYDSDYSANAPYTNNPYNIRVPDRSNEGNPRGYVQYPSLVDATDAARKRLEGKPGFFEGANPYAKTITIEDLLYTYAPPKDPVTGVFWNDTEGLIKAMVRDLNAWLPNWSPPVTTPSTPPEPIPGEGDPVAAVFGKVPKPPSINKFIPSSQNGAWDNLGKRANPPNAFVLHRMEGTLLGTDGYFRRGSASTGLTNIGVGVAATDGSGLAGTIYEWNTPELDTENRAGWANGEVKGAYGDGKKYVDLFGINAVNRDTESCEISGQLSTPLDEKSRNAIAARLAWRADQYGAVLAKKGEQFDYSTFPFIPSQDRNFTIWHQEFTIGTGKTCPGPVVMGETDDLIARAKVILQKYQTGAAPTPEPVVYAEPQPVGAGNKVVNSRYFIEHTVEYVLTKDVVPRQYADPTSPATGPKLTKGSKIKTLHVVSDLGESADLTFEIDAVKVGDYQIKPGSRISAEVVIP